MKNSNEIRDYQHTIARKRDGMVKTELQKKVRIIESIRFYMAIIKVNILMLIVD